MTLEQFTVFMGWNAAIQVGMLAIAALFLMAFSDWATRIHGAMFGLDAATLKVSYFNYVAGYKIIILVFCVVPYLVLRLAM